MLGSLHVLLTSAAIWLLFIPWALLNTVMFIVGPAGDAPPLFLRLGALALAVAIGVLIRRRPEQGPQILVPLAFVAFAASVLGSLAWTEGNQSLFGFASPEGLFAYFLFVPMAVLTLLLRFWRLGEGAIKARSGADAGACSHLTLHHACAGAACRHVGRSPRDARTHRHARGAA